MQAVTDIGRSVLSVFRYLSEIVELFRRTMAATVGLRPGALRVVRRLTTLQLLYTGSHAVVPLTVASIAVGTLVISQAAEFLPGDYVDAVVAPILVREVVPVLTFFLLIARSGTAITIDIASMKLNDELAALRVMDIPMEHFIVLPRLIGMIGAFLMLQIYAYAASLVGGYYAWAGITATMPSFPLLNLLAAVDFGDVGLSFLKVTLFGLVVSLTAVQHGLSVRQSRREIPIVTTQAVVRSLLLCFVINTAVSLSA